MNILQSTTIAVQWIYIKVIIFACSYVEINHIFGLQYHEALIMPVTSEQSYQNDNKLTHQMIVPNPIHGSQLIKWIDELTFKDKIKYQF